MKKVILRYKAPQRVFHWVNLGASVMLLISGLAIYSPEPFAGSVPTATWFALHGWFAVVLVAGIIFHVIYDAFIQDSFGFMWFGRDELRRLMQITKNFLGLSPIYPKYGKYHPMQIGYHWMVAGNLFALILTGAILWKPTRILFPLDLVGLGWDFIYLCRTLHDLFTATLMALVIGHAYFGIMIKKNWAISRAMIWGRIDYDHYARFHEIAREVVVRKGAEREAAQGQG